MDSEHRDKENAQNRETVTRREMMRLAAGAMIAPALPEPLLQPRLPSINWQTAPNSQTAPRRFFTPDEFAMVDELSELIIPADDHSPGAREAKVADYLDQFVSEAFDDETRRIWREGLKLVDQVSNEVNGRPFMQSSEEQRIAALTRMARKESSPQTPEEEFFVELKSHVARGYYTSKIGIHQELEYKGNTYLREFEGIDVSKRG
jgi:hypothetical protein